MTIGPIIITPDERIAAQLEEIARRSDSTPAEIALQIIEEHFQRQEAEAETPEDAAYAHIEGVLVDNTGIEKKDWSELGGAFHSGVKDSARRIEEILEEEWLRDED